MANPLFSMLGGNQFGNLSGLVQQFQQFKRTFQGNPQQQIQQMLNSGKVTQEQYNRTVQMAQAFQQMLK